MPRWLLFFLLLTGLAAAAVAAPLIFNLRQQLTPAKVAAARSLWTERGPRDYDLVYQLRLDDDPKGNEYRVEVRAGQVTRARVDDAPATDNILTIDRLFDLMSAGLAEDAAAGKRNFTLADFDLHDGHPRRFVRRVKSRGERTEVMVKSLRGV